MTGALQFASLVIQLAGMAARVGGDVIDILDWGRARVEAMRGENRDPSPDEWSEINRKITEAREQLHRTE